MYQYAMPVHVDHARLPVLSACGKALQHCLRLN